MDPCLETRHKTNHPQKPHAKEILILEEDSQNATYLNEFLGSKGYHVSIAKHEEEGWQVLQTQNVDGILLSLDDTTKSGQEIVRSLRNRYSHIPLVVMGTELNRQTVRETFKEGVKGYISKPIFYNQLNEALFIFEGQYI